jgi:hypothetical protein
MVSGRVRVLVIGCLAAGAAAAAALAAAVNAAPSQPVSTLASNKRAAQLDANKLLASLQLPAGATRLSAEPSGDGGWLKPLAGLDGTSARSDVHAWWEVPTSPLFVIGYVEAHPPAGATQNATGSGSNGQTGTSEQSVSFSWPAIPGVLRFRALTVTVTSLQGTVTGVLAEAESDWFVPRPAGEQIPAGVHEVDVTSAKLNGPTTLSLSVTNPATVHRIVSLIDAMPVAQPVAIACPALLISGARVITLTFRARAASPVLAKATYTAYRPLTAPSGQCTPVHFSIRGRPQDPLIGGEFVPQLGEILGVSLTSG